MEEQIVIYNDGKFKVVRRNMPNGKMRVSLLRKNHFPVTKGDGSVDFREGWMLVVSFDDIRQARGVGDAMLCAGEPVERECNGYGKEEVA